MHKLYPKIIFDYFLVLRPLSSTPLHFRDRKLALIFKHYKGCTKNDQII